MLPQSDQVSPAANNSLLPPSTKFWWAHHQKTYTGWFGTV